MPSFLRPLQQKLRDATVLGRLYFSERRAFHIIREVMNCRLTYLDAAALAELYRSVARVEAENRSGVLIEAGVALGGSSLVMATAKRQQRPFYMYDAFEVIPPPSEQDGADAHSRYQVIASGRADGIRNERYYGYRSNLYEQVQQTLQKAGFIPDRHHIHMVRGFYEDTLRVEEPVALAHLDCDWYDSVMICLERIEPHLVPGGTLIVDDYQHWSGCRKAVDDYFADRADQYRFVMASRLHIIHR